MPHLVFYAFHLRVIINELVNLAAGFCYLSFPIFVQVLDVAEYLLLRPPQHQTRLDNPYYGLDSPTLEINTCYMLAESRKSHALTPRAVVSQLAAAR